MQRRGASGFPEFSHGGMVPVLANTFFLGPSFLNGLHGYMRRAQPWGGA